MHKSAPTLMRALKTEAQPFALLRQGPTHLHPLPVHPLVRLQQTAGNQAVQRMLRTHLIQAKLTINQPGDEYEQEADLVADQVMRMELPGAASRLGDLHGQDLRLQRRCAECEEEEKVQRKSEDVGAPTASPVVDEVLRSAGQPLDETTRAFFEPRFGHDFSNVRLHTDARAADSARAVDAMAYTVGEHIVFAEGQYAPHATGGRALLAHEMVHVVQQSGHNGVKQSFRSSTLARYGEHGAIAEADAGAAVPEVAQGRTLRTGMYLGHTIPLMQRQVFGRPSPVDVRSPVLEELITQESTIAGGISGRHLLDSEINLARGVFGNSIDYSRVRLISTSVPFLEYRTVPNVIRVPEKFTISNDFMAETFIHELTHVWQYQHGGTSYMSASLATQIEGTIRTGSRNAAYCYTPTPGKKFFEYTPEQQAMIVENYFNMVRDLSAPNKSKVFQSNYSWVCSNDPYGITWDVRQAEIAKELPLHEQLINQMRAALPRPEAELLMDRARDVMQPPVSRGLPLPDERQLLPVKPFLELRF